MSIFWISYYLDIIILQNFRYYPKGGGHVSIAILPIHLLKSVNITERGQVRDISGFSFVSGVLPIKVL